MRFPTPIGILAPIHWNKVDVSTVIVIEPVVALTIVVNKAVVFEMSHGHNESESMSCAVVRCLRVCAHA